MLKNLRNSFFYVQEKLVKTLLASPYGGFFDTLLSWFASLSRFGYGHFGATGLKECNRPKKPLILYQYEGCPFCRRVRETLSVLGIEVLIYPCPRETFKSYAFIKDSRYRPKALEIGGKAMFPLLVDPNFTDPATGKGELYLYESSVIRDYLWKAYGDVAKKHWTCEIAEVLSFSLFLPTLFRPLPHMGLLRTPSRPPEQPLELYSTEGSPYCRIVREVLDSMELPYLCHNCPRGYSSARRDFKDKFGPLLSSWRKSLNLVKIPLLVDPNQQVTMVESLDIIAYLRKTYQLGPTPDESLAVDYSSQGASAQYGD